MGANDDMGKSAGDDSRLDDIFGDEQAPRESYEGTAEVDEKLNDFFSEDGGGGALTPDPKPPKPAPIKKAPVQPARKENKAMADSNPSLDELNSIILSLEWEISDEEMERLMNVIAALEKQNKADKIAVAFLQLLGALGKYIQKKKAESHPEAISLITSVHDKLERALTTPGIGESGKKKLLAGELNKYKHLKEQLKDYGKGRKAVEPPPRRPEPEPAYEEQEDRDERPAASARYDESAPAHAAGAMGGASDILEALERINETLRKEFQALREELRSQR